jgi:hypothetical protein
MDDEQALETAVANWAREAKLDVAKYTQMFRDFYEACPHVEAALSYLVAEATIEISTTAKRLPIEQLIDASVKVNVDRYLSKMEKS